MLIQGHVLLSQNHGNYLGKNQQSKPAGYISGDPKFESHPRNLDLVSYHNKCKHCKKKKKNQQQKINGWYIHQNIKFQHAQPNRVYGAKMYQIYNMHLQNYTKSNEVYQDDLPA